MTIAETVHPEYMNLSEDWEKWRLTYEGGRCFIDKYLERFSTREDDGDYVIRKRITYCPAFAKAAINDIKNAIFQRTSDISRMDGPKTYTDAVKSLEGGVDLKGSSMNSFVGTEILPELLSMGRVGVYVDMPPLIGETIIDHAGKRPYVYTYKTEDIRSWGYDAYGQINRLLLREYVHVYDEKTLLPVDCVCRFRFMYVENGHVEVRFYDIDGNELSGNSLKISKIPFVLFKLPTSLMADVADYQIALMNLASSDIAYAIKSNFPFYTEQYDPRIEGTFFKQPNDSQSTGAAASKEIKVGASHGRRYTPEMERPGFIHPSAEPLRVSMDKQKEMQQEIRLLVNLAVSNMNPKTMASAESKALDNEGLESGLSFIGLVLEAGERQIAEHWSAYVNDEPATVNYPTNYSLRNEADRRAESEHLEEMSSKIPSDKYKRSVAKRVALLTIGPYVSVDRLEQINKEIDSAKTTTTDPKEIIADLEAGLVGNETASEARGYPPGEVEKAAKDHAERLARINESQGNVGGEARGVKDTQAGQKSGKDEKVGKPGRGEAKL